MKKIISLLVLVFVAPTTWATQPIVQAKQLSGFFKGESMNGPCSIQILKTGDILVFKVDQNSGQTISMPVYASLLTTKISGDKCGRVVMNNDCGPYEVQDNMSAGAGHNNELYVALESIGG